MFITFEGGEGSGKTTLIKVIREKLGRTLDIKTTREPGGSKVAEAIRDVLLNPEYEGVTPHAEALLFAAARAQHIDEVILPALNEGKIVLCDRYIDSSLAYQGYARGLGFDFILEINRHATENMPDRTFYIDVASEVGIGRIAQRKALDRLDQESKAFHHKVRLGYHEVANMFPDRIRIVDGAKSLDDLAAEILEEIRDLL
jgi:dTMP kinase